MAGPGGQLDNDKKGSLLSQVGVEAASQCCKANDKLRDAFFVVTKIVEDAPQFRNVGTMISRN